MIRPETRGRARALQMLYAWDVRGGPPIADVIGGVALLIRPGPTVLDRARSLAMDVVADRERLDRETEAAADNWRLSRLGAMERNILRLGIHELLQGVVPVRVAIDESVRLAHWFVGAKASGFVNGVLDRIARAHGRL